MTKKVLIVGCGNIGSRHLQAISKINQKLEIHVVEPNKKAVLIAKKRLKDIKNSRRHNVEWYNKLEELNSHFDLSIVATNSDIRKNIVSSLLEKKNSKFLLEKIVCQSETDYKHLIHEVNKHKGKAWINLVRRYFPSYKILKKEFQTTNPICMSVLTGDEGLGSTAIHFIDLFSWLCDEDKIHLSGDMILPQIQSNKRGTNFREFAGIVLGSAKNSNLIINFKPKIQLPVIIDVWNENKHITIDETNQKIIYSKNLAKSKLNFRYIHVSDATPVVQEILTQSRSSLPTLENSLNIHKELFRMFNNHISKVSGQTSSICPIT